MINVLYNVICWKVFKLKFKKRPKFPNLVLLFFFGGIMTLKLKRWYRPLILSLFEISKSRTYARGNSAPSFALFLAKLECRDSKNILRRWDQTSTVTTLARIVIYSCPDAARLLPRMPLPIEVWKYGIPFPRKLETQKLCRLSNFR